MTRMTRQEMFELLSTGTRTAHVASTRADGSPHVAPVWFSADGTPDSFVIHFTTSASSVKGTSLRRDGRVALTVDDPHPPFAFVIVEGTAELSEDLDLLLAVATRLGEKYMGRDRAVEFGKRNAVVGELLATVRPVKLIGEKDLAD
jgi:PPOX class probable F420-dependent enzyme